MVKRQWRPDWRLWLFTVCLFPPLVWLGVWQLDRADQKEQQLAQWQQQLDEPDWQQAVEAGLTPGQPVRIHGVYRQSRHWLLDNRTRDGRSGYEVLSVFRPDNGPAILVNRGWLAAPRRRSDLPRFDTPVGQVTITGRIAAYPTPPVLAETGSAGWPRRVQALQPQQVAVTENGAVAWMLRLKDSSQPGALRADWQPDYMGPATHHGYAVQWLSLAVVLIGLSIVASFRKVDDID